METAMADGQEEHQASAGNVEALGPALEAEQEVAASQPAAEAAVLDDAITGETSELEGAKCCICQQPLRGGGLPPLALEATECGHVHHKTCLENWWNFQNCRGDCPYKCERSPAINLSRLNVLPPGSAVAAAPSGGNAIEGDAALDAELADAAGLEESSPFGEPMVL